MSRSSDTRQRTREAAAQLVGVGKRPHEITVDLIYAAIQQGSRTTIYDALQRSAADGATQKRERAQTRWELAMTRDALTIAQTRSTDLDLQLTQLREQAARDHAALQETLAQQADEFRETLASRELNPAFAARCSDLRPDFEFAHHPRGLSHQTRDPCSAPSRCAT